MIFLSIAFLAIVQTTPLGFVPVDERTALRGDPNALDAPDWMVTRMGSRLRVESRIAWFRRYQDERALLAKRAGTLVNPGQVHPVRWHPGDGVRVSDGWIFGVDEGEFGGGLLWLSRDGRVRKELSCDNTPLVIRTRKGVFALQSLNHLMFWYSRLVAVEKRRNSWKTRRITDLHEPFCAIQESERFILARGDYVTILETDGTQREVYRSLYPFQTDSMVRLPNGEIWIGSSQALLRLRPKGDSYAAQWFLPLK